MLRWHINAVESLPDKHGSRYHHHSAKLCLCWYSARLSLTHAYIFCRASNFNRRNWLTGAASGVIVAGVVQIIASVEIGAGSRDGRQWDVYAWMLSILSDPVHLPGLAKVVQVTGILLAWLPTGSDLWLLRFFAEACAFAEVIVRQALLRQTALTSETSSSRESLHW